MVSPVAVTAGALAAKKSTDNLAVVIGSMYGAVKTVGEDAVSLAKALEKYFDDHIKEMKRSQNAVIERSGRILEAAKEGFHIGYFSSVAIVAAGQIIVGQTAAALQTVATAGVLANPIAMTCGAVGAILYGYSALSDKEKEALWKTLSDGLQLGIEIIKSIINFVIDKARKLVSDETRREVRRLAREMKKFIEGTAAAFGSSLGQVTGTVHDRLADTARSVGYRLRRSSARKAKVGDLYNPRAEISYQTPEPVLAESANL